MKKYKVSAWRHNYGYFIVDAEDEQDAKAKADDRLMNGEAMDRLSDNEQDTEEVEEITNTI